MRDLVTMTIVVAGCVAALRRPWIGVLLWAWLSLMNPHRLGWGFAYDAPLAAAAAIATFIGLLMTRERDSPLKGAPVGWFILFNVLITISWLAGLDPVGDFPQWDKVMKINLMLLVTLSLLRTKEHLIALAWVCALSLAILGVKGGVFTIVNGGNYKVWGPPGSFIEDNNEFALALVLTIPLLRFLQMQLASIAARHLMTLAMLLCAASALGSHSRGGLLAIVAMTLVLWWRGKSKFTNGLLLFGLGIAMIAFMPDSWSDRMNTIETYDQDNSALGRFSAWWNAWNVALHFPLGVGFFAARPELFTLYSPYGLTFGTPAAHSIYFQVLGNHGFPGLIVYLAMWISTFRITAIVRRDATGIPQAKWCHDLASMSQVALIGFAVGGAFLSLAYFDLPYYIMALMVLVRVWLQTRGWERESNAAKRGWRTIPGVATMQSRSH